MDLLFFGVTVWILVAVWPMGMAAASNAGHTVVCTTGSQLAAMLANPDVSTLAIQTDITLSDDDWKDFTIPVIVRRNVTVLGNPRRTPLLDMANMKQKVQLQEGASFVFRYLIMANWRAGSWRQAPGLDLLLPTPLGQVPIPSSYGPRPASIPGNNTYVQSVLSPATCSNSSCAPPLERCYAYIAVYEDMALAGQDLTSNGLTDPNGYLIHLRHIRGLCQSTMSEECIARLSPIGCALFSLAQLDTSQSSNTSANGSAWDNTREKCVRNTTKGRRTGGFVGPVVGGAVGGAILFAVLVLVLLWNARMRNANGAVDSARCSMGVIGKSGHQVIKVDDPLYKGSAAPCVTLETRGDGHDHDGCGGRHTIKNLLASQDALPDENNDNSDVAASSAKESMRPRDLGQPSKPLAGGGAAVISPPCVMQPVTWKTSNRADLKLVVHVHSGKEQHGNKYKVATDSSLPTPPSGMGSSSAAAAPADAVSNLVTLLPVVLGRGAFGRVYEGIYRGTRVAVKVVGQEAIWGPAAAAAAVKGQPPLGLPQPLTTSGLGGPNLPAAVHHKSASQHPLHQHQHMAAHNVQADSVAGEGIMVGGPRAGDADPEGAGAEGCPHPCQQQHQQHKQQQHQQHKKQESKHDQDAFALDASVLCQLQQEVEVLGRCDHPNVVRLLGACLTPPRMCLVMELAETSLERLLFGGSRGGAPLPLDTVLHIAIQIAQGLEYLHPTIVHRDLKPANVLINGADTSRPVAKLSDFGLSRLRSTTLPTMHPDAGTPTYMAPECYDLYNHIITHHADMYSFGVLLWTMLTGENPWKGLSALEIAYSVTLRGQRPPMHNLPMHRCPPKLSQLIRQCWEADPRRRPAAAEAVKELHLLAAQLQTTPATAAAAAQLKPGADGGRRDTPNGVHDHGHSPADDTLDHYVRQAAVPYTTAPYNVQQWDAIISESHSISLDLSPESLQ